MPPTNVVRLTSKERELALLLLSAVQLEDQKKASALASLVEKLRSAPTELTQRQAIQQLFRWQREKKLDDKDFAGTFGVSKQYMRAVKVGLMLPSDHVGFKKVVRFIPMIETENGG